MRCRVIVQRSDSRRRASHGPWAFLSGPGERPGPRLPPVDGPPGAAGRRPRTRRPPHARRSSQSACPASPPRRRHGNLGKGHSQVVPPAVAASPGFSAVCDCQAGTPPAPHRATRDRSESRPTAPPLRHKESVMQSQETVPLTALRTLPGLAPRASVSPSFIDDRLLIQAERPTSSQSDPPPGPAPPRTQWAGRPLSPHSPEGLKVLGPVRRQFSRSPLPGERQRQSSKPPVSGPGPGAAARPRRRPGPQPASRRARPCSRSLPWGRPGAIRTLTAGLVCMQPRGQGRRGRGAGAARSALGHGGRAQAGL